MEQVLEKYVIKQSIYKMNNFDNYANENKTEHNSKWPYISDHPYRIIRLEVRKYNMTLIERLQK